LRDSAPLAGRVLLDGGDHSKASSYPHIHADEYGLENVCFPTPAITENRNTIFDKQNPKSFFLAF
jgi:hypothetical protein